MKYFEVGQTVWHYEHGEGKVISLGKYDSLDKDRPIIVMFEHKYVDFTEDGRRRDGGPIVLSQKPVNFPPIINEELNPFKKGDYVWCKIQGQQWACRIYSHKDGYHRVFHRQDMRVNHTIHVCEIRPYDKRPF